MMMLIYFSASVALRISPDLCEYHQFHSGKVSSWLVFNRLIIDPDQYDHSGIIKCVDWERMEAVK